MEEIIPKAMRPVVASSGNSLLTSHGTGTGSASLTAALGVDDVTGLVLEVSGRPGW